MLSQNSVKAVCISFSIIILIAGCGRDRSEDADLAVKGAITQTAIASEISNEDTLISSTSEQSNPTPEPVDSQGDIPSPTQPQQELTQTLDTLALTDAVQIIGHDLPDDPPPPFYYIGATSQILRLESDGVTIRQITNEMSSVEQFDVAQDGSRIVYVSDNRLIELELATGERSVLVAG